MKYFRFAFFTVGILLFLQSCGITSTRFATVKIHTGKPSDLVINADTIRMLGTWHPVTVARSKEPLQITVLTDSLPDATLSVKALPSVAFYLNPVKYALLIKDRHTPQKYTYPANVYLGDERTLGKYKTFEGHRKGDLLLNVSLPHVNSFLMHPDGYNFKSNTGFLGLSLGADYYYRQNKYFNLTAGAITDFLLPLPAPVHYFGPQESMRSLYLSASDNYITGRFSFGYGLLLANNIWQILDYRPDPQFPEWPAPVTKKSFSSGFVLSSYYQTSKSFHIGIVYRPSILNFDRKPAFAYEHSISLDLAWKFKL